MGRAHQIYVPARTLTGAQVTDERSLAQAKLAGRLGLIPTELLEATSALYELAVARKESALSGAGELTLSAEPLVSDFAATAPTLWPSPVAPCHSCATLAASGLGSSPRPRHAVHATPTFTRPRR